MIDDDRYFEKLDPATLLPKTVQLEPENPEAVKVAKMYQGKDEWMGWNNNNAIF